MFVGGGSASTAGGIKGTTIAILFLAIIAEAKGDRDVMIFGRTLPQGALRVVISVTFLGATLVLGGTAAIMLVSDEPLDRILFEVISAFATCGLSVGLSEQLTPAGKYILAALMFAGRIGPIGLASALAIRRRNLHYRYPGGVVRIDIPEIRAWYTESRGSLFALTVVGERHYATVLFAELRTAVAGALTRTVGPERKDPLDT